MAVSATLLNIPLINHPNRIVIKFCSILFIYFYHLRFFIFTLHQFNFNCISN